MQNELTMAKTRPRKTFATVAEGVELLGGNASTAETCGVTTQAVINWKSEGFFPANTWELLREEFADLGYRADPALWRMKTRDNRTKPHRSPKTGELLNVPAEPPKANAPKKR